MRRRARTPNPKLKNRKERRRSDERTKKRARALPRARAHRHRAVTTTGVHSIAQASSCGQPIVRGAADACVDAWNIGPGAGRAAGVFRGDGAVEAGASGLVVGRGADGADWV